MTTLFEASQIVLQEDIQTVMQDCGMYNYEEGVVSEFYSNLREVVCSSIYQNTQNLSHIPYLAQIWLDDRLGHNGTCVMVANLFGVIYDDFFDTIPISCQIGSTLGEIIVSAMYGIGEYFVNYVIERIESLVD